MMYTDFVGYIWYMQIAKHACIHKHVPLFYQELVIISENS